MAERVSVSDLRLDPELYPRAEIHRENVLALFDALDVKSYPPAVIVWRATKQVIDGRVRVADGRATVLDQVSAAMARAKGEDLYASHYLSCAASSAYRRNRPYEGFVAPPRVERQLRLGMTP